MVLDEEAQVDSVAEISLQKQAQIIQRIEAIATTLHTSSLLCDALRVIVEHFDLDSVLPDPVYETAIANIGPLIVGYGLGSFCDSSNAVHQLAFLVALRKALGHILATRNAHVLKGFQSFHLDTEIFDPVMNKADVAIATHFKLKIIQENEHGKRQVFPCNQTIFFMPHCGKALYQNVLACNWGLQLHHVVIIGNSFTAYADRVLARVEREQLLLVRVLPYVNETALSCGVARTHDDFRHYEAAFNDLSVHAFRPFHALHNEKHDNAFKTAFVGELENSHIISSITPIASQRM
ncbi:hypothetical protein CCR75_005531 [Bremia lactucae]|uniref:SRR1-like domain-containing protein n=1 Tax=Bremia lactucae TaxID=4779 RepID=A0A976FQ40_BRELC|nr:hypothetical protein CCR75_005531 [Bremia lactucae]